MWFGVSLLYRSSEPLNAQGIPLFEERIVLLDAVDEANAWQRALQLGPSLDEQYINAEGNQVAWTFERVLAVKVVLEDQLGDGVEVLHRFLREDEVKSLAKPQSLREYSAENA